MPISVHQAAVADKTILCTSLNHFISKVVHDYFPFGREALANAPRRRFGFVCPICYSACAATSTAVLKYRVQN